MNSTCPRCGGAFECGAGERPQSRAAPSPPPEGVKSPRDGPSVTCAGHCDCFELQLPPALRDELAQRWSGCLCLRCLRELAVEPLAPPSPTPSP
jgi:hypothetical protein